MYRGRLHIPMVLGRMGTSSNSVETFRQLAYLDSTTHQHTTPNYIDCDCFFLQVVLMKLMTA